MKKTGPFQETNEDGVGKKQKKKLNSEAAAWALRERQRCVMRERGNTSVNVLGTGGSACTKQATR